MENIQHAVTSVSGKKLLFIYLFFFLKKRANINPPKDRTSSIGMFRLEAKKPTIGDTVKQVKMQVATWIPISSRQSLQWHQNKMKETERNWDCPMCETWPVAVIVVLVVASQGGQHSDTQRPGVKCMTHCGHPSLRGGVTRVSRLSLFSFFLCAVCSTVTKPTTSTQSQDIKYSAIFIRNILMFIVSWMFFFVSW